MYPPLYSQCIPCSIMAYWIERLIKVKNLKCIILDLVNFGKGEFIFYISAGEKIEISRYLIWLHRTLKLFFVLLCHSGTKDNWDGRNSLEIIHELRQLKTKLLKKEFLGLLLPVFLFCISYQSFHSASYFAPKIPIDCFRKKILLISSS